MQRQPLESSWPLFLRELVLHMKPGTERGCRICNPKLSRQWDIEKKAKQSIDEARNSHSFQPAVMREIHHQEKSYRAAGEADGGNCPKHLQREQCVICC